MAAGAAARAWQALACHKTCLGVLLEAASCSKQSVVCYNVLEALRECQVTLASCQQPIISCTFPGDVRYTSHIVNSWCSLYVAGCWDGTAGWK